MKNLILTLLVLISISSCSDKELNLKDQQILQLKEQIETMKATNTGLLDRMSDLSVVSKTGAESIQKSLENISRQTAYIEDLNNKVQSKDSLNLALVMNLKRSLSNINDSDIQVEVRGGLVHVSISDKLLFQSGSSTINARAEEVLGKIATVINDHDELEILVEGHTDNVPMNNGCIEDNWDLSVKRATAVVRSLANEHYVDPTRLTAAGRSYYIPKEDNDSAQGRSKNRRTEIIIQPRLDQFFQLLETAQPLD
ncbi:MAG: flagellar motor protein MotB [Bacteroidota bacterium]